MFNVPAYIERFHLMFLRLFSTQIDTKLYAIKGGCNLRFFFNSVRYSEDLDLDVQIIQRTTLEKKVNKILTTPPLLNLIQGYGITQLMMTAPKQTETTQRWKIQIYVENKEMPLPTKIECSRRHHIMYAQFDNISMNVCQTYHLPPIRLPHYDAQEMIRQKVLALAHRTVTQARDVFDLYHLLHLTVPQALPHCLEKDIIEKAEKALSTINFHDYQSQVVHFLAPHTHITYHDKKYWNTMLDVVYRYLHLR